MTSGIISSMSAVNDTSETALALKHKLTDQHKQQIMDAVLRNAKVRE